MKAGRVHLILSTAGNVDPTPGYSKEQTPDHIEVLRNKFAPLITGEVGIADVPVLPFIPK